MAETIVQEFFNGKEWIRIESEILLNDEGKPTGHFKEISREYVDKMGIFDDIEKMNTAIEHINMLRGDLLNDMYIIHGRNFFELYRAYSYGSNFPSLGHAIMEFFRKNEIMVRSYECWTASIDFICETRDIEGEFTLQLSGADDIIQQVP